jgi:hypothetical protein
MFSTSCETVDHLFINEMSTDFRSHEERESLSRSGFEWHKAVVGYLEYRAGNTWRNLNKENMRNSPRRSEYQDALRLVIKAWCAVPIENKPVLVKKPSARDRMVQSVTKQPRGWIISELMRARPELTNEKLLRGLRTEKLAGMLVDAVGLRSARLRKVA